MTIHFSRKHTNILVTQASGILKGDKKVQQSNNLCLFYMHGNSLVTEISSNGC